jgi:serine/threonine protein kinase
MRMGVHNYVVRLLDSFRTATEFNMVLEWERGGTLQNYLVDRNNLLKEVRAKDIAHKLALGIEYLHEQGIIIDNLNLHTILMNDRTDQAVPKISNFSRARVLEPNQRSSERSTNQTLFLAPEICENKPYDLKADSWAFGVILYFMLAS